MITSRQKEFLSEIIAGKPIPEDKLVYFRERLRDRLHSAILAAFEERAKAGLKQSGLAERIHKKRAQIARWFSTTSNLTLDSISDLMVGLGMDFDGFPFTPIEKTIVSQSPQAGHVTLAEVPTVEGNPTVYVLDRIQLDQYQFVAGNFSYQLQRNPTYQLLLFSGGSIPNETAEIGTIEQIQRQTDAPGNVIWKFQDRLNEKCRLGESHNRVTAIGAGR
jgi:transcriptional regulator with XRE-family HTH domain